MSCHGPSGAGMPGGGSEIQAYPRLGGKHQAYVEQMNAYKSGQRKIPSWKILQTVCPKKI